MRSRTRKRPPAPTDEEILAYDGVDVPIPVAARYLGWTDKAVRLAIREGRAGIGVPIHDNGIVYKCSPGGLVNLKRNGSPYVDYETIRDMVKSVVAEVVTDVIQDELYDIKAQLSVLFN